MTVKVPSVKKVTRRIVKKKETFMKRGERKMKKQAQKVGRKK